MMQVSLGQSIRASAEKGAGSKRGRASASFYKHVNQLSAWQKKESEENKDDAESYCTAEEVDQSKTL